MSEMIARFSAPGFAIGTFLLCACGVASCEMPSAAAATPVPTAVQLAYKPFGTIRYHRSYTNHNDASLREMAMDFTLKGERVENRLIVTFQLIQNLINGVSRQVGDKDKFTRLNLESDGRITDIVGKINTGIQSSEQKGVTNYISGLLNYVLPIYSKVAVSNGQVAARTASVTTGDGRSYTTLVLGGSANYRGVEALRLDTQMLVFEQTFKPNIANSYPSSPGYYIVDPHNGTVLKVWLGPGHSGGPTENIDQY
jgi:hypothetical protein